MALIKHKTNKRETASPAAKIPSIVVPSRRKNRPPQLAVQQFRNRPISICLFPNIRCRISELPKTCGSILKIWRRIINEDIRYQQKLSNLPSFLGVRNVCVKFCNIHLTETDYYLNDIADEDCYPYLRIQIDNYQVGAFILQKWCARIGQTPHQYQIIERKDNQLIGYTEDIYKCNPLLLESLCEIPTIVRISFGCAAIIECEYTDPRKDLYNIPYVRVSSKFGKYLNTHAVRNHKKRIAEKMADELEKVRTLLKRNLDTEAHIEARKEDIRNRFSNVHLSYVGFYTYGPYKRYYRRYDEARKNAYGEYANYSAMRLDQERCQVLFPDDELKKINARDIVLQFRKQQRIAAAAVRQLKAKEEELQMLQAQKDAAPVVDDYNYLEDARRPRNNKQAATVLWEGLCLAPASKSRHNVKPADVNAAEVNRVADVLAHFGNIEVDYKTKEIRIKF